MGKFNRKGAVRAMRLSPFAGDYDRRKQSCGVDARNSSSSRMSQLGHVWTAPWQELSDVFAALVGCGHVSGLLMRQVWPLALMLCAERVPIESPHLEVR